MVSGAAGAALPLLQPTRANGKMATAPLSAAHGKLAPNRTGLVATSNLFIAAS